MMLDEVCYKTTVSLKVLTSSIQTRDLQSGLYTANE